MTAASRENDERQAAFYDRLAPRYDALLTTAPIDLWTRRAFQELVAGTVARDALLLDFGCGTGLDAQWYAQRGYRVLAYDVSAGMLEQLRRRCASEIARGQVVPIHAPFAAFATAMAPQPRPDAVVANYGVLSAFSRPEPFFESIARLLGAGAPLVISVLNPFFWKDMVRRWWWAALLRSAPGRAIRTSGPDVDAHRHFVGSLVAAARPAFRLTARAAVGALVRRHRGTLDWDRPRSPAQRAEARGWKSFPLRSLGMFLFLTFRRV
jgi:SAM-dependent methyltransferase